MVVDFVKRMELDPRLILGELGLTSFTPCLCLHCKVMATHSLTNLFNQCEKKGIECAANPNQNSV